MKRNVIVGVLVCTLLLMLSACDLLTFDAPPTLPSPTVRTDLTGRLIVFDQFGLDAAEALEYENGKGFVPLKTAMLRQQILPESYDPSLSPDGKWQITFDKTLNRFVVLDAVSQTQQFMFQEYVVSLWQIAWSPDGRFLAYSAADQQGEWLGRIMVVDIHNNWMAALVGFGFTPRWLGK
ncbi:MAG: hypothetical protein OHK0023_01290 [Anaerolineae bacterium]